MNYKMISLTVGKIMLITTALLVAPLIVSIVYNDGQVMSFLYTILAFLLLGIIGVSQKPKKRDIYAKEGLVIVAAIWLLYSVFGGLPFFISGEIPNFIDCIFETASGFTTTGATILKDVEVMSKSLLFWRSFTHWIGGMGVLVLATAILSNKEERTTHIMRAEMPGITVGKLASKWQFSVRILYTIYIVLTVLEFIFLLLGKMNVFDAMVYTFGTAGTGGYGVHGASIGHFDSAYIDYVVGIFMILFGVNFNIYYIILIRQFVHVRDNSELKLYFGIVLAAVALITLNILGIYENILDAIRYAFFQVASIITTTGYATADFCNWPTFSQIIILILMFIGGCTGSTAGGLKVARIGILIKHAANEVRHSISPRRVLTVKNDKKPLEAAMVNAVLGYVAVYILVMVVSIIIISLDGFDVTTTITSVITAINNVGPGLGTIGPTGNFSEFSNLSKLILSFDMLAGRLEIFSILAIFSPSMWKK